MKVFAASWFWAALLCAWPLLDPAARAQQAGRVDPSFGASLGLAENVQRVLVQPDGKILIAGSFKRSLVRLNADGGLDTGFDIGAAADGLGILALAVQADGKVIVAGGFSHLGGVARNGIARVNVDGSVDAGFDPDAGSDGLVDAVAVQADGKVVIGGDFDSVGGVTRNNTARLNADGSLDMGFDPGAGASYEVSALAVQADGKVVIGGSFDSVDGVAQPSLARLNADGSLDTGYDSGAGVDGSVYALAVQADGKVVIGGFFSSVGGVTRKSIARLNLDGTPDPGFDPGRGPDRDGVRDLAVQADGKVVISGDFFNVRRVARNNLARLNADGTLDTGFDPGVGVDVYDSISGLAVQADGKVVIGGRFANVDNVPRNGLARLNADGSLDDTLQADVAAGPNLAVDLLAAQADGKVVIEGIFTNVGGTARTGLARLNADGSLDMGFNPGVNVNYVDSNVDALAVQADGKVIIGSTFSQDGEETIPGSISRLNADGSVDTGFGDGVGVDNVSTLAVQPDGKIIVGGAAILIRLDPDGSLDTSFNAGTDVGDVYALALQTDGKVVIGGFIDTVGGVARKNIARLNPDGTLDTGFDPGAGADNNVYAVAVQTDGKVVVGGGFANVGGAARRGLARLNADGSLDTGFHPDIGPDDNGDPVSIGTVAVQPNGAVIIRGVFASVGGVARAGLARLNADGSLDTGFDPAADDVVYALATQADGKIFLAGNFTEVNGIVRNYLARLDVDGSVDSTFVPGAGVPDITALALQPDDGRVVIGGSFSNVNGAPINALARLNADGSLDATFAPGLAAGDTVDAVALQPDDGAVLAADEPTPAASPAVSADGYTPGPRATKAIHNPIIRCGKVNGAIDVTFNAYTDGKMYAIVGLAGRLTLLVGAFSNVDGAPHAGLARLAPDGSLDTGFVATTDTTARALSVLSANGTIIVGGDFAQVDGVPRTHVARLNADGSLDASFNPGVGPNGSVNAVRALANGQVLIGGSFTLVDGLARNGIALLNADGSLNAGFASGTAAMSAARQGVHPAAAEAAPAVVVNSLDVQPGDGKVIIGGLFNAVDGVTRPNVARLNTDGSVDTTFDPGTGTNAAVNVLQLQPDGRTLLGGGFSDVDGLERRGAARLLGDADAVAVPTVTIAAGGDGMAVEGGEKGRAVVRRTGDTSAALTVRYKVKGSAKAGVDYKALPGTVTIPAGSAQVKIKIKPIDNDTVDGTRLAKVKLLPSTDGSYLLGDKITAKIKVIDND